MENKKGLFAGIHRDGYTWKDSLIVSILIFFMMFFMGSGIGLAIGTIIKLFSNEGNAEFLEILGDNFAFLGYWIIAVIYLLLVKSDKPILRAFGREPRGNTVKMALWGLLIGLCLNALCIGIAVFHGDIQLSFSSFPVLKFLLVFLSVFVQSGGEELLCRGVLYQRLRKGYRNPWVAILVNRWRWRRTRHGTSRRISSSDCRTAARFMTSPSSSSIPPQPEPVSAIT